MKRARVRAIKPKAYKPTWEEVKRNEPLSHTERSNAREFLKEMTSKLNK